MAESLMTINKSNFVCTRLENPPINVCYTTDKKTVADVCYFEDTKKSSYVPVLIAGALGLPFGVVGAGGAMMVAGIVSGVCKGIELPFGKKKL